MRYGLAGHPPWSRSRGTWLVRRRAANSTTRIAVLLICAQLIVGCAGLQQPARGGETGVASYYGDRFRGRATASGEKYDPDKLTAAHLSHPFGTRVQVTNLKNGRSVVVRINDRGPFTPGRIIDLSTRAAKEIGLLADGIAKVRVQVVGK
jgi:rare lipoprotein A